MSLALLLDEDLIRCFQLGADAAVRDWCLNELFGRHRKRLTWWCARITGQRAFAADVAQETFIQAYQKLDWFPAGAKFSAWLFSIARAEFLRSQAEPAETPVVLSAASLPDELERVWQRELVERLLGEALDETERRVFVLHFAEDVPLGAITRLLGLRNPSGAEAYLVNARRKLKRAVERWKTAAAANPRRWPGWPGCSTSDAPIRGRRSPMHAGKRGERTRRQDGGRWVVGCGLWAGPQRSSREECTTGRERRSHNRLWGCPQPTTRKTLLRSSRAAGFH